MFGRVMNESIGKVHFWLTFVGVYSIFMPMHFLGLAGHNRRYFDGTAVEYMAKLQPVHVFISISAFITIAAQLIFLYNFLWSLKGGKKADDWNPWHATTLEWSIPSPPPHDNFAGVEPVVYHGPYEFSVPGAADDYIPQHLAPERVRKA